MLDSNNPGAALAAPGADPDRDPFTIRVLVLTASLREQSLNARLAQRASELLADFGVEVERLGLAAIDAPTFDQDAQDSEGIPDGPRLLRDRMAANDAVVIVSPEYNASIPGGLKNAIDWTSRFRPQPFHGQHVLLMSASPSMVGGNRGLWALRVPLEHLGARVDPDMFSLAQAQLAFGADESIADPALAGFLSSTIHGFIDMVEADVHYPRIKTAWVEYLGERHSPQTARVDAPR